MVDVEHIFVNRRENAYFHGAYVLGWEIDVNNQSYFCLFMAVISVQNQY